MALLISTSLFCHRQVLSFTTRSSSFTTRPHGVFRPAKFHSSSFLATSAQDEDFLSQAVNHAKTALGHTFPNPAVGCVIVRQDTNQVLGAGFHPRAGFPHAEVFALLEATGHVTSGVEAASSVLQSHGDSKSLSPTLQSLVEQYTTQDGPQELFGDAFANIPVTAYVTLEPCCHQGKTPPCAATLAMSQVDRVVVGFGDPNPSVDGGGVKVLHDANIDVDLVVPDSAMHQACEELVQNFVKRIIPKDYDTSYNWMTGAMRSALRRECRIRQSKRELAQVSWKLNTASGKMSNLEAVDELELDRSWMEALDEQLWAAEVVNLRLNKVVGQKKLALRLGERIAETLGAHVAGSVGHTVLLYRPGLPPVIDLENLVSKGSESKGDDPSQEG